MQQTIVMNGVGATNGAPRSRRRFSLLEYIVLVAIIVFMIVMAVVVWSNIRNKAYEARAEQNYEYAKRTIESYWLSVGQDNGGYKNLTVDYMQGVDPTKRWVDLDASVLAKGSFDDLPDEYFASILILSGKTMPDDELAVLTISETGTVYYALFKGSSPVETSQLAFSEFKDGGYSDLQAKATVAPDNR
jgi:type II secretory pathway pseudopilin PulG